MKIEKKLLINLKSREKLSKINKIRGDYNEYLAVKHFSKLGYTVIKLVLRKPVDSTTDWYDYIKNMEQLECHIDYRIHSELLRYLKKTDIKGLPDLLCYEELKGQNIFFVECKCDPKQLNENQKKRFLELDKMGYPIYIFSTKIKKIEIENGETSIERFK